MYYYVIYIKYLNITVNPQSAKVYNVDAEIGSMRLYIVEFESSQLIDRCGRGHAGWIAWGIMVWVLLINIWVI